MTAFAALLKNDLKLFFIDWKAVVLLIVSPFLFICFFTYALSPYLDKTSFIEPFSIALVDNENTAQTRILAKQIEEISIFKEVLRVGEKEAVELISQNRAASVIIIPEGFTDSIAVGENKPVTVILNKSMPLQSFVVKNLVQSAANLVSAGQSAINTIYYYSQKAGLKGSKLDEEFRESTMKVIMEAIGRHKMFAQDEVSSGFNLTYVEYFTAALIVVFLMFAGMPAMKMIVTERSYGLTRRLNAAAISTWQVIASKFIVSLILSSIQFMTIIALTYSVFKSYWGAPAENILVLLASVVFAVSSWSIFVSAVCRTPASADVIGNLGILLMAIIGGNIYPLSSMPGFVRALSKFTINRWAMEGFMLIFSGDNVVNLNTYIYPLLAIGAVFLALAALVMKLARK